MTLHLHQSELLLQDRASSAPCTATARETPAQLLCGGPERGARKDRAFSSRCLAVLTGCQAVAARGARHRVPGRQKGQLRAACSAEDGAQRQSHPSLPAGTSTGLLPGPQCLTCVSELNSAHRSRPCSKGCPNSKQGLSQQGSSPSHSTHLSQHRISC